jgi:hypothetical protein
MKRRVILITGVIVVLLTLFLIGKQLYLYNKQSVCFLDTSLTFYVVSIPDCMCVNGTDCHEIFKISLHRNSSSGKDDYKINVLNIDNKNTIDLGHLHQDYKSNTIIWKRAKPDKSIESVELQDIGQQQKHLLSKLKTDTGKLILISDLFAASTGNDEFKYEQYFRFIVRVFLFDGEPKEYPGNFGEPHVIVDTYGGPSYYLLAIENKDGFIYKSDHFSSYKRRIENSKN